MDQAIAEALRQRKPVYISVSCNLPGLPYPTFDEVPVPFAIAPKLSNPRQDSSLAVPSQKQGCILLVGSAVVFHGPTLWSLITMPALIAFLLTGSAALVHLMSEASGITDHP